MNFKIVIPMYNVEEWVDRTVESIVNQNYENFQCVFIDDFSTDKTASIVGDLIKDNPRCSLLVNEKRELALSNIYKGFEFLNCDDEDVLLTVDGDDWLDGNNVLTILKEAYEKTNCLLTYGNYTTWPEGVYQPLSNFPDDVIANNSFRTYPWISSSLRTYKYKLWKNIKREDLIDDDGDFYKMAWDLAFMYPMLEMAGERIHHLQKPVYVYNRNNPLNDNKVDVTLQIETSQKIVNKKPYERLFPINSLPSMIPLSGNKFMVKNPLDLLTPSRFDVTSKTLYARHKEKGVSHVWSSLVYEHLLNVWGGFREMSPPKDGVDDFYNAFHNVLDSIKTDGFDASKSTLPVYKNKFLLNGSHRLSAAIQYDKPVVCENSPKGTGQLECSSFYFQNRREFVPSGLDLNVGDSMALEYCRLKKNTFVVTLYQQAFNHMDLVRSVFDKYGIGIVYQKEISLADNFQLNYMLALYGDEDWMQGSRTHGFPGAESQASFNFSHGKSIRAVLIECDSVDTVLRAKNEIRDAIGAGKGSMHTTDTRKETWRNACICFHNPTLIYMSKCPVGSFHETYFKHFISETKKVIENSNIDIEDVCVGGSAPLSAYGKRDCRDFDILHLPPKENIKFNDVVSSHNDYIGYYGQELEQIIFNPSSYFYIDGLKFISPDGMMRMKLNRGEEKDYRDVMMMRNG